MCSCFLFLHMYNIKTQRNTMKKVIGDFYGISYLHHSILAGIIGILFIAKQNATNRKFPNLYGTIDYRY